MEITIIKGLSILSAVIYGILVYEYSKKIVILKANNILSMLGAIVTSVFFGWLSFQNIPYYIIYILMYLSLMTMYIVCFKGKFLVFMFASGNFIFHLLCLKGIIITTAAFLMKSTMYEVVLNSTIRSLTTIILFMSASLFLFFFRMVYTEEKINRLVLEISQVQLITTIQAVLNVTLIIATLVYSYNIDVIWMTFYHLLLSFMMVLGFYVIFKYCIGVCLQKDYQEKEEILKYQIQSQLQQYQNQSRYIQDLRRLKHDYKNQMKGLSYIVESGDYEKINQYINDLSDEVNASNLSYIQYSNHYLIDAILQDVHAKTQEYKIKFEAMVQIEKPPLSDLEICTVLSNLMNNAVEACLRVDESERFIKVCSRVVNDFWVIKVNNSFDGIVTEENGRLITRKKDKNQHGLGVGTVRKIIKEHDGEFEIQAKSKEKIFEVFIYLPVK